MAVSSPRLPIISRCKLLGLPFYALLKLSQILVRKPFTVPVSEVLTGHTLGLATSVRIEV